MLNIFNDSITIRHKYTILKGIICFENELTSQQIAKITNSIKSLDVYTGKCDEKIMKLSPTSFDYKMCSNKIYVFWSKNPDHFYRAMNHICEDLELIGNHWRYSNAYFE